MIAEFPSVAGATGGTGSELDGEAPVVVTDHLSGARHVYPAGTDPATAMAHAANLTAYQETGRPNALNVNSMAALLNSDLPEQQAQEKPVWQQALGAIGNVAEQVGQAIPERAPRPAVITGGQAVGLGLQGTEAVMGNLQQSNQLAQSGYEHKQALIRQAYNDKMQQQANEEERADRLKHLKLQTANDIAAREIEWQKMQAELGHWEKVDAHQARIEALPKVESDGQGGLWIMDPKKPDQEPRHVTDPERVKLETAKQQAMIDHYNRMSRGGDGGTSTSLGQIVESKDKDGNPTGYGVIVTGPRSGRPMRKGRTGDWEPFIAQSTSIAQQVIKGAISRAHAIDALAGVAKPKPGDPESVSNAYKSARDQAEQELNVLVKWNTEHPGEEMPPQEKPAPQVDSVTAELAQLPPELRGKKDAVVPVLNEAVKAGRVSPELATTFVHNLPNQHWWGNPDITAKPQGTAVAQNTPLGIVKNEDGSVTFPNGDQMTAEHYADYKAKGGKL